MAEQNMLVLNVILFQIARCRCPWQGCLGWARPRCRESRLAACFASEHCMFSHCCPALFLHHPTNKILFHSWHGALQLFMGQVAELRGTVRFCRPWSAWWGGGGAGSQGVKAQDELHASVLLLLCREHVASAELKGTRRGSASSLPSA